MFYLYSAVICRVSRREFCVAPVETIAEPECSNRCGGTYATRCVSGCPAFLRWVRCDCPSPLTTIAVACRASHRPGCQSVAKTQSLSTVIDVHLRHTHHPARGHQEILKWRHNPDARAAPLASACIGCSASRNRNSNGGLAHARQQPPAVGLFGL